MATKPLFEGLIIDELDNRVDVAYVGGEPCYVVNDAGFLRHIPSVDVDRQILDSLIDQVKGNEELFTEQTASMLGQDDIFTRAIIQNQLKNLDKQIERIFDTGIPEAGRSYMGMMGFKVIINHHGEVVKIDQPGMIVDDEE